MNQFFLILKIIFEALGIWRAFLNYVDADRIKEAEKKTEKRNKAVDDMKKAKTEDEFDKAQDSIVRNKP